MSGAHGFLTLAVTVCVRALLALSTTFPRYLTAKLTLTFVPLAWAPYGCFEVKYFFGNPVLIENVQFDRSLPEVRLIVLLERERSLSLLSLTVSETRPVHTALGVSVTQ